MKKVIVNNKYTYATDLDLDVGDHVRLPGSGNRGEWIGEVTQIGSDYEGEVKEIIEKYEKGASPEADDHSNFGLL